MPYTGAYTLRTLLAAINEDIEAAGKRILALQEMETKARANNDETTAQRCAPDPEYGGSP